MDVPPSRDELIVRAKLAEKIERFDDLRDVMKTVVELGTELNNEERNSLSTAYRYAIAKRWINQNLFSF